MAIKLADTLAPMADFPAVMAEHTAFEDGETLQEKYETGQLGGGGGGYTQLSQAEYDALTEDEKMNGKEYRTYDTGHIYKLGVEYGKDADISRNEVLKTYVSLYDLNTKKGLSLAWENNVDNTQKIIDALEGREEFIDSFSSSTNRIGIVGNYGTTINNFHIIKRSADLSIITATTNDGTILNRTYTNGTLSDWCVSIAVYTSLEQLGLTAPTTVGEVFVAMPNKSTLMLNVEAIADDGNARTVTDVPRDYGVLTIEKYAPGRHRIEYSNSLGGSASDVHKWIGSIKGNDGTDLRWIELTGSAKIYTTMAELGLDGATATIQDVIDAISVGEIAMLRTDAFNNDNWKTQCNNIQYGYLKIEKTQNGLSNIELQEVVVPNRRYFGAQASGKFANWVSATDTKKGLAYNSQYYKIDITKKGNKYRNGVVKFSYNNGNMPCEVAIFLSYADSTGHVGYYTYTYGTNCIQSITLTGNDTNVVIGIELTKVVYGTQLLEVNDSFCTINNLTAEQFTGDTVASQTGADLELTKGTKVVTEIGKSTYAVGQKILQDTDFTTTDKQARFEIVTKNVESSVNGKHQTAQLYQMTPIEGGTNASISYIVYEDGRAQLTMYPHTKVMPRNDYNIVCEGYLNELIANLQSQIDALK